MKDFFNMLHIDEPDAVFAAVIDEKGYLKLPETIELEPEMILTNFVEDGVLLLYTMDYFERLKDNLSKLNNLNPSVRLLERRILLEAVKVETDKSRRIFVEDYFLDTLRFDDANKDGSSFPVKILKYPSRLWIASLPSYEKILKKLQEQKEQF